jgi:hypothetical protein
MAERMKQLLCAVLLLAATAPLASARIGESDSEISARYGESVGDIPTQAFGKVRGFKSADYVVAVKLVNGRSQMEMFSKTDQSEMTASEIDNLLKANGAGVWKAELVTGRPGWRRWRREDDALVALYDAGRHFLYINSKQFYEDQGKKIETGEPPKKEEPTPVFFGIIPSSVLFFAGIL